MVTVHIDFYNLLCFLFFLIKYCFILLTFIIFVCLIGEISGHDYSIVGNILQGGYIAGGNYIHAFYNVSNYNKFFT